MPTHDRYIHHPDDIVVDTCITTMMDASNTCDVYLPNPDTTSRNSNTVQQAWAQPGHLPCTVRPCTRATVTVTVLIPTIRCAQCNHAKNKFAGRCIPFSVLGCWDKNTGIFAGAMPYPGSRDLKQEKARRFCLQTYSERGQLREAGFVTVSRCYNHTVHFGPKNRGLA